MTMERALEAVTAAATELRVSTFISGQGGWPSMARSPSMAQPARPLRALTWMASALRKAPPPEAAL